MGDLSVCSRLNSIVSGMRSRFIKSGNERPCEEKKIDDTKTNFKSKRIKNLNKYTLNDLKKEKGFLVKTLVASSGGVWLGLGAALLFSNPVGLAIGITLLFVGLSTFLTALCLLNKNTSEAERLEKHRNKNIGAVGTQPQKIINEVGSDAKVA